MHALPPPYVPPEYQDCNYSEIPEPYKSQIDAWIGHTTIHYEMRAGSAKQSLFIALGAAAFVAVIIAAILN